MDSQKLDTSINIRLTSEVLDALKKKAKKDRRNVSDFIRIKLEDLANGDN